MKSQMLASLLIFSSFGLAACGGGDSSNQFVASPSSGTDGSGSTGGTVSSAGIYVSVVDQEQSIPNYLHAFYQKNDVPCKIAAGASDTDLECLLNVRELDLFQQGLKLEFNVPAGLCDFIADTPYWFYNLPVGYGPKTISVTRNDQAGTGSCSGTNNTGAPIGGVMNGHTCTLADGTVATVEGATMCAYDYSGDSDYGTNCCEGAYTITTNYTTSTGTNTVAVKPNQAWGGSMGKCAAGPHLESDSGWIYNKKNGFPYQQIRAGKAGVNKYYKIKAPITYATPENIFAANMWDFADYKTGTHPLATRPTAMKYSVDSAGNTLPADHLTNSAYSFVCYDGAMEVKHRIRLYINEWDKASEFANWGSTNDTVRNAATPDAPAGSTCDITTADCDDIIGWNWILSPPASSGWTADSFPGFIYKSAQ